MDFLRFLLAARDPLRRFAWSRFKNCGLFTISAGARDPLRRSCASKRSRCGAVRICLSLGEPSAEIVRVEALSLWRRAIFLLARETAFGSCLVVCAPAFAIRGRRFDSPLVRGSSGLKIAAFKYKRSTRSVLLQLRLENRNL